MYIKRKIPRIDDYPRDQCNLTYSVVQAYAVTSATR